jgi:L-fuculokinase
MIGIFDIGKTNKKFFVIDENYRIVWEKKACLPETTDEDGFPCEDVKVLTRWVQEGMFEANQMYKYPIRAFNFSAYGASLVHLDVLGSPMLPLYNYLKPFPDALQKQLNDTYGTELPGDTASPVLGSLNSGMQLYRLKHEHALTYNKFLRTSLHLPQYLSFQLSGQMYSDITSIGCHTMLWDFKNNSYHRWVTEEGIDQKLAPLMPSTSAIKNGKYWIGSGLHDSSAALIPYLESCKEPFALISTGTWSITLNPFNDRPLTGEELAQDCLCYLSYNGTPVKASRLFAGNTHEQAVQRLAEYYQTPVNYYQQVAFDPAIFAQLLDVEQQQSTPYATYEMAYHRLMMDIMQQQQYATNLVIAGTPVTRIYVDGGFSSNPVFMQLLANAFPDKEVYAAEVPQSTAMGAAMAIHKYWNPNPLPTNLVQLQRVHALANGSLTL